MTDKQNDEYVNKIWTDPKHPAAFASANKVYEVIRKKGKHEIGVETIKNILSKNETYSVQKPVRINFDRNRVIVKGIDDQWDGDLASMENVSKYNDGVKYLLVLIDIYSRYLNIRKIKDKKSTTVVTA